MTLAPARSCLRDELKNTTSPSAVQTTPSTAMAQSAGSGGIARGGVARTAGSTAIADRARLAATGPSGSRSANRRLTMMGAAAYPSVATSTRAAPSSSSRRPATSTPSRATTPPSRRAAPPQTSERAAVQGQGQEQRGAERDPGPGDKCGRYAGVDRNLDEEVRYTPDRRAEGEEPPRAGGHHAPTC